MSFVADLTKKHVDSEHFVYHLYYNTTFYLLYNLFSKKTAVVADIKVSHTSYNARLSKGVLIILNRILCVFMHFLLSSALNSKVTLINCGQMVT